MLWLEWMLSNEGPMHDCSPDQPFVLICDSHGSHLSLEFLRLAKARGVIVIWRPPHTSHVTQGEDVICFGMFKGMLRKATAKAIRLKEFLIAPYNDLRAWAGKTTAVGCSALANSDFVFCVRNAWTASFSPRQCMLAWQVTGLVPFTQHVWWELKAKEELRSNGRERVANGVTGMHAPMELTSHTWERIAGIRNEDGDVDVGELNEQIDGMRQSRHGGRHSTAYWNSFRGMEELLEDRERDELERIAAEQEREERQQERQGSALQTRQQAKVMVDELVQFVIADGGRWRFKHREGRTGAQLKRDHLDAVFIAVGKRPPPGRMEDNVESAQEIMKFDKQTLQFNAVMIWDESKAAWGFFLPQ